MNTKHTFWSLCNTYDKIEIPIIQRDYAQGRDTPEVNLIREKFINDFLIESIVNDVQVELDFVYGSVLISEEKEIRKKVFIPLDGQQRLTTLFLLYYYVAVKEKCIDEVKDTLLKFTYETRPSAYDFTLKLISACRPKKIVNIKDEILDADWFDPEWVNDPTIMGMITMLNAFSKNIKLNSYPDSLFEKLIDIEKPLVSFYFIPLEKFGLTENLYIRMNARGKMLTDFESFKSEFFKIITPFPDLAQEVKSKIEYAWVENLWGFKEKDSFIVDKPFMVFLSYITEMIYMKNAEFRAKEYESNFLSLKVLSAIYSKKENLEFLIFAIDTISLIKQKKSPNILWDKNTSMLDILGVVISKKNGTLESLVLFSILLYLKSNADIDNMNDFIRVIRNLIQNTKDNSRREWPKLISSIENLIDEKNVYDILLKENSSRLLDGFYVPQRDEEIFKAKLIRNFPAKKEVLFQFDDNKLLKGNIKILIAANYNSSEELLKNFDIKVANEMEFDFSLADRIYETYTKISKNNFNDIWGDLLISSLYRQTEWGRLLYDDDDWEKHPSILFFVLSYIKSKKHNIEDYIIEKRKNFVCEMIKQHIDLETVRDVKCQLYLYYIIHSNIYKSDSVEFFRSGYNFGWLGKTKGFSSLYVAGIENDNYFEFTNPIFQIYDRQFRYNCGLNDRNALDIEIVGSGRKNNTFQLLEEWANN